MRSSFLTRRLAAATLGLALLGGCDGPDPVNPTPQAILQALTRRSMALSLDAEETIGFRALDASGHAIPGLSVTLTADNAGTLATTRGGTSTDSAVTLTTGTDGAATAYLTVRNVDDPTTVTARAAAVVTQPLTFVFTGKCDAPLPGTIDDFCGITSTDWAGYNGLAVSLSRGALLLTGNNTGGSNQYPVAVKNIGSVDFTGTQKVTTRIRVASTSSGPAFVQLALNDVDGVGANMYGSVAGGLMFEVPNDGAWHSYTYDFTGKWVQWDGRPVDPARIKELVFLVNPNINPAFTGTVELDDIRRVP